MFKQLPLPLALACLSVLFTSPTPSSGLPSPFKTIVDSLKEIPRALHDHSWSLNAKRDNTTSNSTSTNTTGKALWILQDTYAGKTFFDDWTFFTSADPTNGLVEYVDRDTAFANGLVYVEDDGTVIMKGDNTSTLPLGQNRQSVRIQSNKTYTGALIVLDLNRAPWGCGVWPAFWSLAADVQWPQGGEIDIIEGVHDNVHNQVTWHTEPGCTLVSPGNYTGSIVGQTECNANINSNAGCGITDWSRVSYGETFDSQGGGMYVMKWDETGIAVWYFYRVSLPQDIVNGVPDPTTWVTPSAELSPGGCDPFQYFNNHAMVFDITFCGDWAGNTYATTPGCTGTCPNHLMDPTNFVNASWSINSLKVYRKQDLSAVVSSGTDLSRQFSSNLLWLLSFAAVLWIGFP